jgi:flagellar hook-associated protein 3 FlgL
MIGNRVTQRMVNDTALYGLQTTLAKSQRLQEQLSSGRLVSKASDDPSAASSSMVLRSQRRLDEQYLRNIEDSGGRLATADAALQDVSTLVRRAKELLVSAQDPSLNDSSRAAIGAELEVIGRGVIDAYNTRWLERPVFGGTVQGLDAVDSSGAYLGDDLPILSRISRDVTLRVDVVGSASGADVLPGLLAQAAADITANSPSVAADQDALDAALTTVLTALGDVGARAAQLETTKQAVENEHLDFTARISENEDVDLPKAIMDLQASQVAYQTALGAAGKILQTSLLDYLR